MLKSLTGIVGFEPSTRGKSAAGMGRNEKDADVAALL
jgi:hypothetical protein